MRIPRVRHDAAIPDAAPDVTRPSRLLDLRGSPALPQSDGVYPLCVLPSGRRPAWRHARTARHPELMTALAEALAALGLPATLEAPLAGFAALFHKWNQRINLSAARSEPEVQDHIVDCLHLVPLLRAAASAWPPPRPVPVLDVGSGGGLPAVVVAICLPDVRITALEPIHKKHAFLRTAARELALPGLEPLTERIEVHGRHAYAAAMSRATIDLRDWLLLGLRHVSPGGVVFGFEAIPRDDLPPGTLRHPYLHLGKPRAIVALSRTSSPST